MEKLNGFHHIALNASDFDKSYKFYTECLGLTEYRRWKTADGVKTIALLECGNGNMIELFSSAAPRTMYDEEGGNVIHFAFRVDNAKYWYDKAIAFGCESHMEPSPKELPANPPIPCVLAFVKGPDGELIEFFEEH
ncbi:MAG: VOC family protein [Clostridia bacterium]|nr:VOC family protein [Clostridia bacterium]